MFGTSLGLQRLQGAVVVDTTLAGGGATNASAADASAAGALLVITGVAAHAAANATGALLFTIASAASLTLSVSGSAVLVDGLASLQEEPQAINFRNCALQFNLHTCNLTNTNVAKDRKEKSNVKRNKCEKEHTDSRPTGTSTFSTTMVRSPRGISTTRSSTCNVNTEI